MMACSRCANVLDALRRDPRLRIIPLGARALFILLAEALEQLPGRAFCLGNRPGSTAEIALMVSASETEVETHLESLLECQLLIRRATDGALTMPEMPAADHATAARQNGGLGGRPRSGETSEQARARRAQGHFKLPIIGGQSETQETQEKPNRANPPRACATTTKLKELIKQSCDVSDFAAEMARVAGVDPGRRTLDSRPITGWFDDGIPQSLIHKTIADVARRESYSAGEVHSFRYFDKPIREAHARQPQPGNPVSKARADQWEAWINGGCQGSKPSWAA
jgi:hypothetical protein